MTTGPVIEAFGKRHDLGGTPMSVVQRQRGRPGPRTVPGPANRYATDEVG